MIFKSAVYSIIALVVIFLFTFIWNWMKGNANITKSSLEFTLYISIVMILYYILFTFAWSRGTKDQ